MKPLQEVRRPLVGLALAVAAGLAAGRVSPLSPAVWFVSSALIAALAGRLILRSAAAPLLYLACALLAMAAGALDRMPDAGSAVAAVAASNNGILEVRGVVCEDPAVPGESGAQSILFRTEEIRFAGRQVKSRQQLRIYPDASTRQALFGELWVFRGRYFSYDQARGSAAGSLRVTPGGATRLSPAGRSLWTVCNRLRQSGAAVLAEGIRPFTVPVQVLQALMLGYRQVLSPELYQIFSRSGVFHIFAISGLHVVVMAAILIVPLKLSGISRPYWGWLLIPALFLYVVATGMKASALRAFLMAAVYFAAPMAGRRPDGPSAVALSAILLLACCPGYIIDPGFLLSFVVVIGLLMAHSRSEALFRRLVAGDGLPVVLLHYPAMLLLTSLAAWFFSTPVSVQFFNQLSLAGLPGNPLVIPLSSMIMVAGTLSLLAGAVCVPAAVLFNQANLLLIDILLRLTKGLAAMPGGCPVLRAPGIAASSFWYAALVLFLTGPVRWRKGAVLLLAASLWLWFGTGTGPTRGIRICRAGDDAVAVRLTEKSWVLALNGVRETGAVRLLRREGAGRLEHLLTGQKVKEATAARLASLYRPHGLDALPAGCAVPIPGAPGVLLRTAR